MNTEAKILVSSFAGFVPLPLAGVDARRAGEGAGQFCGSFRLHGEHPHPVLLTTFFRKRQKVRITRSSEAGA